MDVKRMTEYEYKQKQLEVLNRFPADLDANTKYYESVIFHKVVNMLVRDADPYKIILDLININEDAQKSFESHLLKCHYPVSFYIPNETKC